MNREKQNTSLLPQKYEAAQRISPLIIIINVFSAANHHIRMISEGSCDTEDCSNDALLKISFDHGNKLHFSIHSHNKTF